jgi:hypothetical protein
VKVARRCLRTLPIRSHKACARFLAASCALGVAATSTPPARINVTPRPHVANSPSAVSKYRMLSNPMYGGAYAEGRFDGSSRIIAEHRSRSDDMHPVVLELSCGAEGEHPRQ